MKTKNKNILKIVGVLVLGILLGWLLFGGNNGNGEEEKGHDHAEASEDQIWTCSMHPQIRRNEPGACPICGMDLIPADEAGDEGENPNTFQMSENAMRLANITTTRIGESEALKEIRLNGKVEADERKVVSQSTHIPGRIEQLSINFTGERVRRGQTLAMVYSPELVTAQEELLQAADIQVSHPELFDAAKEKLRNWRIGENQINQILNTGRPLEQFPITADVSGIVTKKLVDLGDYVERGMPIYEISDLSKVWVLFDLYEDQIGWIREGSRIEYSIRSIPAKTFEGEISFIDPLLNAQSRVARARVEVENSEGRLKPGMFASGLVQTAIGQAGGNEIVVPKSAVLWTGKRSVVYIKEASGDRVGFTLREVVLGPSLGESYIIEEGLEPGEEIVTNGAFTVDAAVQLAGKPSMMNPAVGGADGTEQTNTSAFVEGEVPDLSSEIPEAFKEQLNTVVNAYLDLKEGLVEGHEADTQRYSSDLLTALENLDSNSLSGDGKAFWDEKRKFLFEHTQLCKEADTMDEKRENFIFLSQPLVKIVEAFGADQTLYVNFCPMANDNKGAYWLSAVEEIRNPFMPEKMLTCGEIRDKLNSK